jgi:hypothetical protein
MSVRHTRTMSTPSPKRIPVRSFRAPDGLWERFNTAVDQAPDPEAGISVVLRQFLRWYAGEPGAKLPERPTPVRDLGHLNPGDVVEIEPNTIATWSE